MADELTIENYHGKEAIRKKEKDILKKWSDLLDLLNKHKTYLHNCCILVAIMREVDTITASIKELEVCDNDNNNNDDNKWFIYKYASQCVCGGGVGLASTRGRMCVFQLVLFDTV